MNETQFKVKVKQHGAKFAQDKCFYVELSDVEIVEEDDQVREAGIITPHLKELTRQIENQGQLVPITVERIKYEGEKPEGAPTWRAVDGCHRHGGLTNLNERFPDNEAGWGMIWCTEEDFQDSEADRLMYQVEANQHLASKKNTPADIARVVNLLLKSKDTKVPDVLKKEHYEKDPECYMEDLTKWIQKKFSFSKAQAKTAAHGAAKGFVNNKLKSYDKSAVIREFINNNTIGWSGKKPGDESNGFVLYPVGQTSHVNPNISGNALKKKTHAGRNSGTKAAVVVYIANTLGKKGCHIDDERTKMIQGINKMNGSHLFRKNVKLIDKILVAPQKIGDTKEDMSVFFEVPVKSNGDFDVAALPKKGW